MRMIAASCFQSGTDCSLGLIINQVAVILTNARRGIASSLMNLGCSICNWSINFGHASTYNCGVTRGILKKGHTSPQRKLYSRMYEGILDALIGDTTLPLTTAAATHGHYYGYHGWSIVGMQIQTCGYLASPAH